MAKWISSIGMKKGGLHESMGIPQGENIPNAKIAAAAKKKGTIGKQARLAQTLASFHTKK